MHHKLSLKRINRRLLPGLVALCGLFYSQVSSAQNDGSPEAATNLAVSLMKRGKWLEAQVALQKIIAEWSNDSFYKDFPPFGTIYYNRGFCEMQLKQFQDATKSFEICYRDFPDKPAKDGEAGGFNIYRKTAVFQWAAAQQYQENYEEAIKLYKKFMMLEPQADRDHFSPGAYHLNLGICYAKTDDRANAEKEVGMAIARATRYRIKSESLWSGFLNVVESYTRSDNKSDGRKAVSFVDRHAPNLLGDAIAHGNFAGRILTLGKASMDNDQVGLAWRLFGLMPTTDQVLLAGKIADPAKLSKTKKKIVQNWQLKLDTGEPMEISTYFRLAELYQKEGLPRAQFAIYDHMGSHYKKTKFRPQILYSATRTASQIGEMIVAQEHGLAFLKEFPTHELRPEVAKLLLSSMFFNGEYERCIEIAGDLRKEMALGSAGRDLPDFVYSGSLYYLGRYKEAQPELDKHVGNYPDSGYIENSSYYQASNLLKLFEWQRAASLLDAWLKKYEPTDSPLLDVAYLDRATCYFALSNPDNGGNSKALELAGKVISDFPQSGVLDRVHSLKGDVQQNDGRFADAEASYKTALSIAEPEDHMVTAASAQMQLVAVTGAQEKYKEAVGHYDQFFAKYFDSFYAPNAAVAALPAFVEAAPGRVDEVLERIEGIIVKLGQNRDSDGVERSLNAYTTFLLKKQKKMGEEVIARLDAFPNEFGDRTLQAWLLITKIGIIEERLSKDPQMKIKSKVYYESLENDFKKEELGDFILYRLGAKIAESNPFKAAPWFEKVLESEDPEMAQRAQLQLATIKAGSQDAKQQDEAIADLLRIRSNMQDKPEIVGPATLNLARLYHIKSKWAEANTEWKAYMTNKGFRDDRANALFNLAESYEKLGKNDEALAAYSQVTALYSGLLDISAPSVIRIAKIVWARGDREKAFKFVNTFHFRMKANQHPKVREMEDLRGDYLQQLKAKGEWQEEFLQVRDGFGQIKPAAKK